MEGSIAGKNGFSSCFDWCKSLLFVLKTMDCFQSKKGQNSKHEVKIPFYPVVLILLDNKAHLQCEQHPVKGCQENTVLCFPLKRQLEYSVNASQ